MDLYTQNEINLAYFDPVVRRATADLGKLLVAAAETGSATVETTHWLIVLAQIPDSEAAAALRRVGISLDAWKDALRHAAGKDGGKPPPSRLSKAAFHETTIQMLETAAEMAKAHHLPCLTEALLTFATLDHLTSGAARVLDEAGFTRAEWRRDLERRIVPAKPVTIFSGEKPETVDQRMFSAQARRVLRAMQAEAEALGFETIDARHLLLALLQCEQGTLPNCLALQGIVPAAVGKTLLLHFRGGVRRTRSALRLDRDRCQALLCRILDRAGEEAGRDRAAKVAEVHLTRAFLAVESSARHLLAQAPLDLQRLTQAANEPFEEDEREDEGELAKIDEVKRRLKLRLVGQDAAIERILPYVELMRFGFGTPGRPVGTFLFCGQSGCGKTEMAKELARAVYGSEEQLIFLEMGQFNAPESMNIFIGAAPGYVGYGEGKLTNGLRDKPRAVVLFDEIEKAHSKVLDALLRFLDEGRIDDPAGPVRDGSGCIVVMTSNVGAQSLTEFARGLRGTAEESGRVREHLREEFKKEKFRIEFLNRVDELVLFRTLTMQDYKEIVRRLLERDLGRLSAERQITVTVDEALTFAIAGCCARINEGARTAQRLVHSAVILPVIREVLAAEAAPPLTVRVTSAPGGTAESVPVGNATVLKA